MDINIGNNTEPAGILPPNKIDINIGRQKVPAGIKPPGRLQLDKTLTKSGWAADAAATGTAIREVASSVVALGKDLHENYYTKTEVDNLLVDIVSDIVVVDGNTRW